MTRKKTTTDLATCDILQLRELADKGNTEAREALRKQLQDKPELAQQLTTLAFAAQEGRLQQMLDKMDGARLLFREQMRDMQQRIAGDNPTPLERLLADRVVMCWFDVQDHELRYSMLNGESTYKQFEWRSRMLDRARNRYLSAVIALAKIRRLALPAMLVNIADKQINTMGAE